MLKRVAAAAELHILHTIALRSTLIDSFADFASHTRNPHGSGGMSKIWEGLTGINCLFLPRVLKREDKRPTVAMYGHGHIYTSKCSDLKKKLIDTITTSNFYLKLTMKMTWLQMFFGLFFIPANGRAKSAQQLISTVLPFHPRYFPCVCLSICSS